MSTINLSEVLGYAPKFYQNEAIEIRFHGWTSRFQLLATVSENGAISYRLNNNPAGNYTLAMTNLNMDREDGCFLPLKAYECWQEDLLTWILSAKRKDDTSIYTITDVR
jgi:hypothetical protein